MKRHAFRLLITAGMFLACGVMLFAGGAETICESPFPIDDPAFAKDGKAIAWTVGAPGKRVIRYRSLEDGKEGTVEEPSGDMVSPTFSIDGKKIFFCVKDQKNFDLAEFDLVSRKGRVLMRTPEDEFRVDCPRNYFTTDYQKMEKKYEKLFFLCGKEGSGELRSIRSDREFPAFYFADGGVWNVATSTDGVLMVRIATGSYTGFSLGGEPAHILLQDAKGLWNLDYTYIQTESELLNVNLPFDLPERLASAGTVADALFAPNSCFILGVKGGEAVRFKTDGSDEQPLGFKVDGSISADAFSRRFAVVQKRGTGYALILTPSGDKEVFIVNGHHPLLQVSSGSTALLMKNDFVVVPNSRKQFYDLYEENRYQGKETFISADAVYFLFHLFYDYELMALEKGSFRKEFSEVVRAMAVEAGKAYAEARDPEAKGMIKRLWSLFWAAHLLGNPDEKDVMKAAKELPEQIRGAIMADLAAILEAKAVSDSAILGKTVDFSLFKPRGHYEEEPELRSYFRTVALLGQIPLTVFRSETEQPSDDLPMIAALWWIGTRAKVAGRSAVEMLAKISEPLDYLVGQTEDISFIKLTQLLDGVKAPANPDGLREAGFIADLFGRLKTFPKPKIRSFKPLEGNTAPGTSNLYVLFFPARFTLDSYIMQNLVYKAVGEDSNARMLPKSLDVAAALGSKRAERILLDLFNEGRFKKYKECLAQMGREIENMPPSEWAGNLYRGWLKTFRDILLSESKGVEPFTRSDAWSDRMLNVVLGSWTTLRHDTILYNKMSGAERGDGGENEDYIVRGLPDVYVDPHPALYGELKRMVGELTAKLDALGYLPKEETDPKSEEGDPKLKMTARGLAKEFTDLLDLLEKVAGKQAKKIALTPQEHEDLFDFGGTLERLSIGFLHPGGKSGFANIIDEEISLIVDVANAPENPFSSTLICLEAAIGRVFDIYVLHDRGAGPKLYHGGTFSYYEFERPAEERMTDAEWRTMLGENRQPPLPSWTRSFISDDKVDNKGDRD